MITSLKELLTNAEEGGYAVIAPDFISLQAASQMIEAAETLKAPLILSFAPSIRSLVGMRSVAGYFRAVRDEIEVSQMPVCLHLDHAGTLDEIKEAIDYGFTSVMIDASLEPFERNVELTQQTILYARPLGVSVEAELGQIKAGSDYFTENQLAESLTDPTEAAKFVALTEVDALAVSIGNQHGAYRGAPKLDFERLAQLDEQVNVPLVLHGASGIPDEDLQRAVSLGIRKINVYSHIVASMHTEMLAVLQETLTDPFAMHAAVDRGVQAVMDAFIGASGSAGRY